MMINFFRKLFNHDKIELLESGVDALLENNKNLEAEVRKYKGYKLKYQVAMLQNDEEEYLELLEMAEKVEKYNASAQQRATLGNSQQLAQLMASNNTRLAAQAGQGYFGQAGSFGGLGGRFL